MSHIFISHATEDKESFVRPLAHALKSEGLKVWYDEFSLRPGDSLRRSIDKGLAECHAGLVVLSQFFFAKAWALQELNALFTADVAGRSKLIPVWHEIGLAEVAAASPLLADRIAINSNLGFTEIARRLAEQFPPDEPLSGTDISIRIEALIHPLFLHGEALSEGIQHRFLQINGFKEEYGELFSALTSNLSEDEIAPFPDGLDEELNRMEERLRLRHSIPADVYLTTDEPIDESDLGWWRTALGHWAGGTLEPKESANLVAQLDFEEMDEYFVLLGIPNFQISGRQRDLTRRALVALGSGFESGYREVDSICCHLRALPKGV
jgi:hypothetical protein